jgi:hypothetical protein
LWKRRGEERSPFSRPVHDASPATNLNGQDKLCIWPGQKPHTSKQVLAGFELLFGVEKRRQKLHQASCSRY